MPDRSWTPAQRDAIEARGGALLVSAAAGSGKTAVLVERVLSRLTDPVSPVDADRLLVVTFTRAAAAEMKERIAARLLELREARPDDDGLLRQQLLLSHASISTVHSFCKDLLREHFYELGLSPEFRILDDSEMQVLQGEAMQDALDAMYGRDREGFSALAEAFGADKSDRRLAETIRRLYAFVRAHPFPDRWYAEKADMYRGGGPIGETPWGKSLIALAQEALDYCAAVTEDALRLCAESEAVEAAYGAGFASDLAVLRGLAARAGARDWDALYGSLCAASPARLGQLKDKDGGTRKPRLRAARKLVWDTLRELAGRLCADEAACREDLLRSAPLTGLLFEAARQFSQALDRRKAEKQAVDFGDLEHLALRLLVRETPEGFVRTDLAAEVAARFDEVMVDEYQDTNETQDLLFRAVSRGEENLFVVGDVKQSIYGFREAMPKLFLSRKDASIPYDRARPAFPACITLDRNFRSRREVTDTVNFFFRELMTRGAGDVDYAAGEALVAGAGYPPDKGYAARLDVIDLKGEKSDMDLVEARHIARFIREAIEGGLTVADGGGRRAAQPRDFCVLLRSAKKHAPVYAKELERCGVLAWAESSGGFFACAEVAVMLSLLRVIDNPMQDIPLLSVLLSPIFGYSPDDLAALRIGAAGMPLYPALLKRAAEGDARAETVLGTLEEYRMLSAAMPSDTLLNLLYRRTGYPDLVLAMPGGEGRLRNLQLLHRYAKNYERSGYHGLHGFLRFLDRLEREKGDLPSAPAAEESANVVRVMSVHKSKGLEFPVCIVAGCARGFNRETPDALLHSELGFGAKLPGRDGLSRYSTLPREAIREALWREAMSEELRVLYVAMTRAREKLVLLATCRDLPKKLSSLLLGMTAGEQLRPYAVRRAGSVADWLLTCALRHPGGGRLRALAQAEDAPLIEDADAGSFEVHVVEPSPAAGEAPAAPAVGSSCGPDEAFLQTLRERVDFVYPYDALRGVPAKASASGTAEAEFSPETISLSRPAFLSRQGMTPAERGTALHAFMQYADYAAAAADPQAELRRLVSRGYLTEEEGGVVELGRVAAFFGSSIARRMFCAKRVWRENRFSVEVPAGLVYPSLAEEAAAQPIVLQGAYDCVFEENGQLVLVDYKTDRVKDPRALWDRYQRQLALYRVAAEQTLGLPVRQCVLYSFWLKESVSYDLTKNK